MRDKKRRAGENAVENADSALRDETQYRMPAVQQEEMIQGEGQMKVLNLKKWKNQIIRRGNQKLAGANLLFIIGINISLPLVSFLLINQIVYFQIDRRLLQSVPEGYHFKLAVLTLLLVSILLGILDYFYILSPFLHLEEAVEEYGKLTGIDRDKTYDKRFVKSSLEQNFIDMVNIQKEIHRQARKAENKIQTTELYALQNQINPHFLYNTLDSIRGLALIHGVDEIATMTESLSRLFRSMIAKEGKMLTLREELANVNYYVTIQSFRFNNRFEYVCKVPEALLDQYQIPNMTLQPLVENAIMHGLEKKVGRGKITIQAYATENRLVFTITDDGIGIEEEKLRYLNDCLLNYQKPVHRENTRYHVGIALLNINKQIKLKFGERYGLYISSTPKVYTAVELVLPALDARPETAGELL